MANLLQGRLQAVGLSDVGRKRTLNEDTFCIDDDVEILLVADGMGGHAAGEVASREAVAAIRDFLKRSDLDDESDATEEFMAAERDEDRTWEDLPNPAIEIITAAVRHANVTLHAMNEARGYPDGHGMGTTVVGLWAPTSLGAAVVFNVGDSRLYFHRGGRLSQLTTDHTLYQQWLDGGQIGPPPLHNIIMRSLGMSRQVAVYAAMQGLQAGDLILVCSDGLTSMVPDALIEEVLGQAHPDRLEYTCEQLIKLGNERGGCDNITVILARYT